jgi:O-antigen polymerase
MTASWPVIRTVSPAGGVFLAGFSVYWLIFLHIGWFSHGGWGTDLPMNLLAWCVMSVLCGLVWALLRMPLRPGGRLTGALLISGAVLMSLPLLWSPSHAALDNAMPRLAGLWAGLVFWLTLRQLRLTLRQQQWLLTCLVLAGLVEAGVVLTELYGPVSDLPVIWQKMLHKYARGGVGVFQQVNVTASFLAMSLGATLLLLGLKNAMLRDRRLERLRTAVLTVAAVVLPAVLTLIYSRTGWMGGVLVIGGSYALLRSARFRDDSHRRLRLLVLPVLGVVAGLLLMKLSVMQALAVHDGSNHQRILTLQQTLHYALQRPFAGYGSGTYEGAYQDYLAALPGGNPGGEIMAHPHNELLYQFAEGGVVALSGALLWCLLYLLRWRAARTPLQAGALLVMLPLLVHTQLEYPLYYSVPHWLALLLLLCLSEESAVPENPAPSKAGRRIRVVRFGMVALMLYGGVVSFQAFRAGQVLDLFETTELRQPEDIARLSVPWILRQRYEQDMTQLRLIRFRTDPDWRSLRAYTRENAVWMSVHAWPDLYRNQIAVLKYLNEAREAAAWQEKAHRLFPWEKDLVPPPPSRQK